MKNSLNFNTQIFHRKVYTPSSLSSEVQDILDESLGALWLEGEIENLKQAQSGHLYFTLKDENALIKAAMWKSKRAYGGNLAEEGLKVLVKGRLSLYAPRGEYQLIIEYLEPQGAGALKIAFEKLKLKLEKEKLFEPQRKKPLPYWVNKVAIISSPQGAAISDFIKSSKKLRPGADLSLYPAKMQGFAASAEICQALDDLNNWGGFDTIVITRGGGSLTDLYTFNEEILARKIASSRIPVLAAIGHSTDLTIAEMVADQKAITPTAAAEIIFRDVFLLKTHLGEQLIYAQKNLLNNLALQKAQVKQNNFRLLNFQKIIFSKQEKIKDKSQKLKQAINNYLNNKKQNLKEQKNILKFISPYNKLSLIKKDIQTKNIILQNTLVKLLKQKEIILNIKTEKLINLISKHLQETENKLKLKFMNLHLVSPFNILKKGYAIVKDEKTNKVINSAHKSQIGSTINIQVENGKLKAQVTEIIEGIKNEQKN